MFIYLEREFKTLFALTFLTQNSFLVNSCWIRLDFSFNHSDLKGLRTFHRQVFILSFLTVLKTISESRIFLSCDVLKKAHRVFFTHTIFLRLKRQTYPHISLCQYNNKVIHRDIKCWHIWSFKGTKFCSGSTANLRHLVLSDVVKAMDLAVFNIKVRHLCW